MRFFSSVLLSVVCIGPAGCDGSADPAGPSDPTPFHQSTSVDHDAAILALRALDREHDMQRLPVELDGDIVRSLRGALAAVHESAHPAADSVTDIYQIRPYGGYWGDGRSLFIVARIDAPELAEWRAGRVLTGMPATDSLVTRYELVLDRHFPLASIGWDGYVLAAPQTLNLVALGERFERVAAIEHASPNSHGGDGNDITAERDGDAWLLTYWVKWGDCPSGCIAGHWWRFRVSDDGGVTFEGAGGTPMSERTDW